jgi:hypothetical protein
VLGDATAGKAEKRALLDFIGKLPPGGRPGNPASGNATYRDDRTRDALRYDILYGLLSEQERKAVLDTIRGYVDWFERTPGCHGSRGEAPRTGGLPNMRWPTFAGIHLLAAALDVIHAEGLEARFARHRKAHEALKAALEPMGPRYVSQEGHHLLMLNAVGIPKGVDDVAVRRRLLNEFGIEIGGGLGTFKGKAGQGAERRLFGSRFPSPGSSVPRQSPPPVQHRQSLRDTFRKLHFTPSCPTVPRGHPRPCPRRGIQVKQLRQARRRQLVGKRRLDGDHLPAPVLDPNCRRTPTAGPKVQSGPGAYTSISSPSLKYSAVWLMNFG